MSYTSFFQIILLSNLVCQVGRTLWFSLWVFFGLTWVHLCVHFSFKSNNLVYFVDGFISQKYGRPENSTTYNSGTVMPYIIKTLLTDWRRNALPSLKKGDLILAKNYQGITSTSIVAKIYNALFYNCIEPKIENIHRKNQNDFRRNRSTTSQILTICRILEGIRAKNQEQQCYLSTLPRPLTPFSAERWSEFYSPTAYQKKPSQP